MRWFLIFLLSILPLAAQAQDEKSVDIAIVVSLDRSESIDAADAFAQIDGLVYTLRHSRFRETVSSGWFGRIALSVVTWSSFGRHEVILPWMQIAGPRDAAAAAAILARLGFVHLQVAAVELCLVERFDGCGRCRVVHLDESEPTWAARVAVCNDRHRVNLAVLCEEVG